MPVELTRVHEQRIRVAVEAAREGHRVQFELHAGEPPTVAWRIAGARKHHAIANGYGDLRPLLAAIRAEFDRQYNA